MCGGVCETGGPDFSGINVFLEIFEFYGMGAIKVFLLATMFSTFNWN